MTDETPNSPPNASLKKSMARLALIQALFQIEFNEASAKTVLNEFLNGRIDEEIDGLNLAALDQNLFIQLFKGVNEERALLDDMVSSVLDKSWPMHRLDPLLRLVMVAGAYEIQQRADTPVKVIISEYVDVAHAFLGDKETAMVNGVLDRLGHSLRKDEFS
ncbi:transcription antitermination factor NusB [Kiloniella laminariae]|uniref:transcription antitermination factor NusB n=1 Tax=Kiloniella laminariae TaxID=454162 RepID=UPI000360737F|nr:transcription antitermination factor NusB [Kiloniella laminariae]